MKVRLIASIAILMLLGTFPTIAQATTHWYDLGTSGTEHKLVPQGEAVTINFYPRGPTRLQTTTGKTTDYVSCSKLDADATLENPLGGGPGTVTLTSFNASECIQSGYCPSAQTPKILVNDLFFPWSLSATTLYHSNGYKFSPLSVGFVVTCNGGPPVAAAVGSEPLETYWSAGRREPTHPPNLDCRDFGHYEKQYGNCGEPYERLNSEGTGTGEVIRPTWEWWYKGYEADAEHMYELN